MPRRHPHRSEVWVRDPFDAADPDTRVVIVSCDDWNAGGGQELLAVPVAPYDPERIYNRFDFGFTDDTGAAWMVQTSLLIRTDRMELIDMDEDLWLGDEPIAALDAALAAVVDDSRAPSDPLPPLGFPGTRQTRFADLHIPGEVAKPVLIVSGSAYASATGYTSVLGARMTSKHASPHRYDVVIRTPRTTGKVVCSDVQTIPVDWLEIRQPDPTAVTPAEWVQIRHTLFQFLGLGMAAGQPDSGTIR